MGWFELVEYKLNVSLIISWAGQGRGPIKFLSFQSYLFIISLGINWRILWMMRKKQGLILSYQNHYWAVMVPKQTSFNAKKYVIRNIKKGKRY